MKPITILFLISSCAVASTTRVGVVSIPAGTVVSFSVTQPVWRNLAKVGDGIYGVTNYPVSVENVIAIPPGTQVQGVIEILWKVARNRCEFRLRVTTLVYSNGLVADLNSPDETTGSYAAFSSLSYPANDLYLDNSASIEFELGRPIVLKTSQIPASKPLHIGQSTSASRCRLIPATPEIPGTVIPGTSGTAPTVINDPLGGPPTVIPGTAATPDTVVGGSPGTPEIPCPPPPAVSSAPPLHRKRLVPGTPAITIGQTTLKRGNYVLMWRGLGPIVDLSIERRGKVVASARARIILPDGPSSGPLLRLEGAPFIMQIQSGSVK